MKRENAPDFPPKSGTPEPIQNEAPEQDAIELEEFLAVMDQAARDALDAQERLQRAVAHDAAHPSPRATVALRRAREALGRARLHQLLLGAVWDSGGREREVVPARFERVRVRRDGVALARVLAKRGRWRTIAFSPATWRAICAWHEDHGSGFVPAAGPIFPGARPGEALDQRTVERAVHALAVRAGVQRATGDTKKSHRFHFTLKAVRELAEAHVVYDLGINAKLAAKVHDHTEIVQDRHYLRARGDAAARIALARAHVHGA